MKKPIVLLLLLIMTFSLFALTGCGDPKTSGGLGVLNEAGASGEGEGMSGVGEDYGDLPGADAVSNPEYDAMATDAKYFAFEPYGPEDNRAYQITGWSSVVAGRPTNIVFPDVYKKRPVAAIKQGAFRDDLNITSITFGQNMRTIGKRSFTGAIKLVSVTFPIVEQYDFEAYTGMDEEDAEAYYKKYDCGITKIAASAFRDCVSLTSFTMPTNCLNIMGSTFSGCTSLTAINMNIGIKDIASSAFLNCTSLTTANFSSLSRLTAIGTAAFKGCTSLTTVTFPIGVKVVPVSCFTNCTSLETITFRATITKVYEGAFYNCVSLNSISLGSSTVIQPTAFVNCPAGEAYGA